MLSSHTNAASHETRMCDPSLLGEPHGIRFLKRELSRAPGVCGSDGASSGGSDTTTVADKTSDSEQNKDSADSSSECESPSKKRSKLADAGWDAAMVRKEEMDLAMGLVGLAGK